MKKEKVYFYPSCPRGGYTNPYCINFKKELNKFYLLLDKENKITMMKSLTLLRFSLKADILILNWIENTIYLRFGLLQFLLVFISFYIIRLRNKKIVWVFHNINPHEGNNIFTNAIRSYLFKHSSLIVSHSKEAYEYAKKYATCNIKYFCHPIKEINVSDWNGHKYPCDILIWGVILPYKGVLEFLENCSQNVQRKKVLILGECKDYNLSKKIQSYCNENIIFENRRANFVELTYYIRTSEYVLFPYIGESISSSGALMDTIAMGGMPIGPNKGAFKDLHEYGICKTYTSYDELEKIINTETIPDKKAINEFIKKNTWNTFINSLNQEISILSN